MKMKWSYAYWRKHPNLARVDGRTYGIIKKVDEGEFNCVDLELALEDLEWLGGCARP